MPTRTARWMACCTGIAYFAGLAGIANAGVRAGDAPPVAPIAATRQYTATADSYVSEQEPGRNFGSAVDLLVGRAIVGDVGYRFRILVRFDVDDIPPGSTITAAELSMYHDGSTTGSLVVLAKRITATWSESLVRWNNQPNRITPQGIRAINRAAGRYEWGVAPIVQGWVDGTYPQHGFMLEANNEDFNTLDIVKQLRSRSAGRPPGGNPPVFLEVVYTLPPTATATSSSTPTSTATATATSTSTATPTSSATATSSPSATPTATPSPSATFTSTATPTSTSTSTSTATPSATATETASATGTPTLASTPTATVSATTDASATATVSPAATASPSPTSAASATATAGATATTSPSAVATATTGATAAATVTASPTGTATTTPIPSPTATALPSGTPTGSATPGLLSHRAFLPLTAAAADVGAVP